MCFLCLESLSSSRFPVVISVFGKPPLGRTLLDSEMVRMLISGSHVDVPVAVPNWEGPFSGFVSSFLNKCNIKQITGNNKKTGKTVKTEECSLKRPS